MKKLLLIFSLSLFSFGIATASETDSTHKPFYINLFVGGNVNGTYLYANDGFRQFLRFDEGQFGLRANYVTKNLGVYARFMQENFKVNVSDFARANRYVKTNTVEGKGRISGTFLGAVYSYRPDFTKHSEQYITFNTSAGIGFNNIHLPRIYYSIPDQGGNDEKVFYTRDKFGFLSKHFAIEAIYRTRNLVAFSLGYEMYWGTVDLRNPNGDIIWNGMENFSSGRIQFGLGLAF